MLKIIVGNKAYSSWSLRGWLAVKQSGLPFEEEVVSLYDAAWPARREQPDLHIVYDSRDFERMRKKLEGDRR